MNFQAPEKITSSNEFTPKGARKQVPALSVYPILCICILVSLTIEICTINGQEYESRHCTLTGNPLVRWFCFLYVGVLTSL